MAMVDERIPEGKLGIARIPDGTGDWLPITFSTKDASNVAPTPTPLPKPTARPEPRPPPPTAIPRPTPPLPLFLRITEIYYDGQAPRTEGDEFIEIQNQGTALAHLSRVRILIKGAQANNPVAYGFPSDNVLSPGDVFVIAKNARQFAEKFGFSPSFEARASGAGYEDTAAVRNLPHDRGVSRFSWALANSGATVALIGDRGEVIDAVAYGHDPNGYLGLHGRFPSAADGQSLRRVFKRGS